jgi:hypothetical protein
MEQIDLFYSNLTMDNFWRLLKIVYLVAFGLYMIFSLVVMAQVKQMTKTVAGGMNAYIRLLSQIHLMVSIGAFVIGLLIL